MELQSEIVPIGNHQIKITELTLEQDAKVKTESQVYDSEKKTFVLDQRISDAWYLKLAVDPSTWPEEFGPLEVENISKLPSRISKRLMLRIKKMNITSEDVQDFLDSQHSS
jgi:hypothetical protein